MPRSNSKKNKPGNKVFGLLFGGMFFGMGALFCWMMGLSPLLKSIGSKDWVETDCVIQSSEVERHHSIDGSTYSIEIRFSYAINGNRVRNLKIMLEGQEAATYRRGTNTRTDTSIFYKDVVLDLEDSKVQQRGIVKLTVPSDSMHSFDSGNNKILWQLVVSGDIPRYPDIKDNYPITVRPLQLS